MTRARSGFAVFCLALLASLGVHLPVYEVLGKLAEVLLRESEAAKSTTVELELAPLSDAPKPAAEEIKPEPPKTPERKAEAPKPKPKREEPEPQQQLAQPQAPPKLVTPQETVPVAPEPPPPTEPETNPLAVTQKSADPNAPAPENPRFIAEENSRVEQETVSRLRNMHRDDATPMPSANRAEEDDPQTGDAQETEVADLQDVRGSEERVPNRLEAEQRPVEPSQPSKGEREANAVTSAEAPSPAPSKAAEAQRAAGVEQAASEPETLVINDGAGSFTIRKQMVGPERTGENKTPGKPSPDREQQAGAREQKGVNLRVSFSQFESTFGSDELREQREAYLAQRRSQAAGGQSRQEKWRKFRAAIENFVPNVQPGEQSALNTAASPFADYLANVHRRIHREFAHRFLGSLPIAGGPFDDRSLHAELEIVINGDGTVHQVGIAETSGFLPFDYGAFDAVMRAAPYPVPPRKILSGDGRVYFHWGFYRNERQCGTFNARPYILPHPKGTPAPGPGPLQDRPEQAPGQAPANHGKEQPAIFDPRDGELGTIRPETARPARHVPL